MSFETQFRDPFWLAQIMSLGHELPSALQTVAEDLGLPVANITFPRLDIRDLPQRGDTPSLALGLSVPSPDGRTLMVSTATVAAIAAELLDSYTAGSLPSSEIVTEQQATVSEILSGVPGAQNEEFNRDLAQIVMMGLGVPLTAAAHEAQLQDRAVKLSLVNLTLQGTVGLDQSTASAIYQQFCHRFFG